MNTITVQLKGKAYQAKNEQEFIEFVGKGMVSLGAWIYFEEKWSLLAELEKFRKFHPEFEERPAGPPTKKQKLELVSIQKIEPNISDQKSGSFQTSQAAGVITSSDSIWFYIHDRKKFGPFSSAEIVAKLQNKKLEPSAFVWRPGFSTWQKISLVGEFSKESMKKLAQQTKPVDLDILVKRKFKRAPYQVDVIAHDNTRVIEARSMIIGEGGLFLATPKQNRFIHSVGSRLKLHFREGDASSFNAVAEIVSIVRGEGAGYCMRFVALSDADRKRIAKYVQEKVA